MNTLADILHTLLKTNIVAFTFRKKDGTIRKARGTRNLHLASACGCKVPTPTHDEQPNSYYDIDKEGWRSYIPTNVISIDCVFPSLNEMAREVYGNEKPKAEEPTREIPISKVGVAVELPPTFGSGTAEKIRKAVDELGEDIKIPIGGGFGCGLGIGGGKTTGKDKGGFGNGFGGGFGSEKPTGVKGELPSRNGKVGKPTDVGYGMALPINGIGGEEMTIDDFAKLVAKYVVAELADRLTK